MRLPPAYRRQHSATYWSVLAVVGATCGLGIGIAAIATERWYHVALASSLLLIAVMSWLARREQHGPDRGRERGRAA